MEQTETRSWTLCLANLKSKLSPDAFDNCIKPLQLDLIDGYEVSVFCPEPLEIEKIKRTYAGMIENSFQEANDKEISIRFRRPIQIRNASPSPSQEWSSLPQIELNPAHTFQEFVVGNNSQFAYSAAQAVAKDSGGTKFNPLLIYGGVGLGKTHLLQAIGNDILSSGSELRVRYVTSESFYREFVDSIQHNKITELSNFYRNQIDVLLMDDVQFLSGKDRTQEEFFHIFNALHQSEKQIVLTSDSPPNRLQGLEDRLVSRFQWGLFVDVQPPDQETREAILKKKAAALHLEISDEIISYLATAIEDNVRILEGAIRQLLLQSSLNQDSVSLDWAVEIVERLGSKKQKKVAPDDITQIVSDFFAVEINRILERGRGTKEVAQARQVAMFLMKELTSASLKSIGKRFGDRDHSTVVHAIKSIEKAMSRDDSFKKSVDNIVSRLGVR